MNNRFIGIFPAYSQARVDEENQLAANLRNLGVNYFPIGAPCPGRWLTFFELENEMNNKNQVYIDFYNQLLKNTTEQDFIIALGGSMLPLSFLNETRAKTILIYADDPESSNILSKHIAPYFDLCLVTNTSCLDTYFDWGCKKVDSIFHPIPDHLLNICNSDSFTQEKQYLSNIFCECVSDFSQKRKRNIEILHSRFPRSFVAGQGWNTGFLAFDEMLSIQNSSLIGWNLHNSVGPTNARYFSLSATSSMQLCDNKYGNHIYLKDGYDVVLFDGLSDCIDKTEYFLKHPNEAVQIALNAWSKRERFSTNSWWNSIQSKIIDWSLT